MTGYVESGVLVAVEGIDGAGKTTQVEHLAEQLRRVGFEVVTTKEPTSGHWGQLIRESATAGRLAPEEELQAFLNDRREHVQDLIQPALDRGAIVLVDRYYFSTVAYQSVRGFEPEELLQRNEAFAPPPDILFLVEVEPRVGLARIRDRDENENLFESLELLEAYREVFNAMDFPYLHRIDGEREEGVITEDLLKAMLEGPLFNKMCIKRLEHSCEPAYCGVQDDCQWLETSRRMHEQHLLTSQIPS